MAEIAHSPDYKSVELALGRLDGELKRIVAHHFAPLEKFERHEGKKYKRAVVGFVCQINRLEYAYGQRLAGAAREITRCAGEGWTEKPEIVRLWRQFAEVVTNFSEHPTKKVSTLIIGKDNMLESYAANRVPEEVETRGGHYVKGVRKNYIVCSERMALANFIGLKLPPIPENDHSESYVRGAIINFSDAIAAAGRHSTELHKSVVLTTTTPCDTCIDSLVAFRPKIIMANAQSGSGYTRDVSFGRAEKALASQGIILLNLT